MPAKITSSLVGRVRTGRGARPAGLQAPGRTSRERTTGKTDLAWRTGRGGGESAARPRRSCRPLATISVQERESALGPRSRKAHQQVLFTLLQAMDLPITEFGVGGGLVTSGVPEIEGA